MHSADGMPATLAHPVDPEIAELLAHARTGSVRAVGRLLSLAEGPRCADVCAALTSAAAPVIGVTGPPGTGKSTAIAGLAAAYRSRGLRVAVLAVDPTSPFSGGALLGDRIRMAEHVDDPEVLIRSLATRGHTGGLSAAVPVAVRLLAALSYDVVLLESVGVGPCELEIAAVADLVVVLLDPGAGDAVQAAKAGLLEIADVLVVNKADREGADQTTRDLHAESGVPVLTLIAARGDGIDELVEVIDGRLSAHPSPREPA
ncbi:GTP-binding protein [Nocardia sp. NPDC005978]|uniref:ArgK/MeaB family GTPase n=1 Tax=Nocardia sp. NPDC005978 TaxID=3156725 RepID=UPI0033BAC593